MIGIIGGTGLYQMEGLSEVEQHDVRTPFGEPSAQVTTGKIHGKRVAFLPRHGSAHGLLPSEINFRANIYALKAVGARRLFSVSAVGSLTLPVEPGHLAAPTQYLDFTRGTRAHTFFGGGLVAHISTAEPTCAVLVGAVKTAASTLDIPLHAGVTYACVEGPRLGNRAESRMLQNSGAQLVGMTNVPEVYLAREAGLCYSTIAVVTDYDCWLDDPAQHASVDVVISRYKENLGRVQSLLQKILSGPDLPTCSCQHSLQGAVMTPEAALSPEKRELLEFLRRGWSPPIGSESRHD